MELEKQKVIGERQVAATESKPRYKLGIALSGGGARGFAHIGALKALEEAGLKPDVIAGVSAGSVAGVLYSSGMNAVDILNSFIGTKFTDFCSLSIRRGEGMFSLYKFQRFLERTTGFNRLEELPIPTYVGVTNLDLGTSEEFHEGDLGKSVVASCSIPIVFQPVKIGEMHYVDGGVLRNLPAWILRDQCEHLIGVNCSPLLPNRYKKSVVGVAMRTYHLMTKANQFKDMDLCDRIIVTPDLAGYQVFNLKDINKAYLSGYAAAHRAIKEWDL